MAERTVGGAPASARAAMREEVRRGLSRPEKQLPPKFFYDRRGSELFERITRLPEYYPTRTERRILRAWMPTLIPDLAVQTLVELGAGSGEKTRLILEAMHGAGSAFVYIPIDVSTEFLRDSARRLREAYPDLSVLPTTADLTEPLDLPRRMPRPALFAFLGSTIGNFPAPDAVALLRRIRAVMQSGDVFLLGADLRKDIAVLEAAYNDAQEVTAAFNLNMLRVLNRELDADFDLDTFRHRAIYNTNEHRIEMYLVSTRRQLVTIPKVGAFEFGDGETVRTEISRKYDRPTVEALFAAAGLEMTHWRTDPEDRFALTLARGRGAS